MKIYSMTATFGKLRHQTLELNDGLNVIEAPNEWGKSTWCAFLVAMLYGIDTRQQTTKAGLADKEHYAPWSGEPMSGRMELNWNGRDITIERSTKGRVLFGQFRAYETATGLDIPELTALNCGQQLLGVERSVFTRAGFIRFSDLPVSQDDALRRRLNNLVTIGDESGAADKLGKQLKDLKNKCRFNRSGLLPQAEYEREQLHRQLDERTRLGQRSEQIRQQQSALEEELKALQNHLQALQYNDAKDGLQKVKEAEKQVATLQAQLELLEHNCADLLPEEKINASLEQARILQSQLTDLQSHQSILPPRPQKPETPAHFAGLTPQQAVDRAKEDLAAYEQLQKQKSRQSKWPFIYAACAAAVLLACFVLMLLDMGTLPLLIGGTAALIGGVITAIICVNNSKKLSQQQNALFDRHPGLSPDKWLYEAALYSEQLDQYDQALAQRRELTQGQAQQQEQLLLKIQSFTGGESLSTLILRCEQARDAYRTLSKKKEEFLQAQRHLQDLQSMATVAEAPAFPDDLTYSREQTQQLISSHQAQLHRLQQELGQCLGQAESIGQEEVLRSRLDALNRRIGRLEDTYYALEMAQEALYQATAALQRRFAPRISKRAQELFSRLTDRRYEKITLGDDLSMSTTAQNEDTLHSASWRSDGTVDQLYLALRLAVAGELTPDAPLVLDDALVRFDDVRLKEALAVLQEEAEQKQVLLFTCSGRENTFVKEE